MSNNAKAELLGVGFVFILLGFASFVSPEFRNGFAIFGLENEQFILLAIVGIVIGFVFVIGGIRLK